MHIFMAVPFAILEKETGDLSSAAWSTIHAAWACDDSGNDESAKKCRILAVELIKKIKSIGGSISRRPGEDIAIIVVLLRRSEQFDEALQLIEQKKGQIENEIIKKVLEFRKDLISQSDNERHERIEVFDLDYRNYRKSLTKVNELKEVH